jgi:hypothetical protein
MLQVQQQQMVARGDQRQHLPPTQACLAMLTIQGSTPSGMYGGTGLTLM